MANVSTYSVIIDAPKPVLLVMVSNPLFLSGLLGHVSILEAYDPKKNDFVTPSGITGLPKKFRVAYIFGTHEGKVATKLGEMEGPIPFIDSITYRGFTYDDKVKWELTFTFKELGPSKTRVTIIYTTEVEEGLFSKFLGRDHFDLADHMVREHIIPFIKLYINQAVSLRGSPSSRAW